VQGWILLTDKAFAETAPSGTRVAQRCVTHEGDPCPEPATFAARKYRRGKMGDANKATAWFFKEPDATKLVITRKIRRKIGRMTRTAPARAAECDGQGAPTARTPTASTSATSLARAH
jgi:hypothetical protein